MSTSLIGPIFQRALWFLVLFGTFFGQTAALALPFAELKVLSAAPLVGDCDSRSGADKLQCCFGEALQLPFSWQSGARIGEASHPGPSSTVVVGCSNPGGLRNKEQHAIDQGVGIWSYSETHLSTYTQITAARALKKAARDQGRLLRTYFSAPAPLRNRSTWAGKHTGVAVTSDFRSKQLQLDWPAEIWSSGRVVATQHFLDQQVITLISIYGLPRGPTWPKAKEQMGDILEYITKTCIFGHSGIVLVVGGLQLRPPRIGSVSSVAISWLDHGSGVCCPALQSPVVSYM